MKADGRPFFLLTYGLLGLLVAAPVSADSIKAALERMSTAVSELNYRGTFVQIQDGEVETLKVVHRGGQAGEAGPRERLITLSGSLRELIRDQDTVKCIYSRDSGGDVDLRQSASRFHAHVGKKIGSLDSDHYSLVSFGSDRVAGREAEILGIRPEDEYRYGFRFWVDARNGMPLRSDMIDPDGNVVQQTMFTEIDFGPGIADEEFKPVLEGDGDRFSTRYARYAPHSKETDHNSGEWVLGALPSGFELVAEQHESKGARRNAHHLIVSDGLAQVSVFVEAIDAETGGFEGESRMGSVNAYGRRMGDFQLTVVGEVPLATVTAIAQGISRLPEELTRQEQPD